MLFAPIDAFGGMLFTIGKYGIATFLPLGRFMLTVYVTMAVFIFVVLGLILRFYKINIFHFLNYIKEKLLNVLGYIIRRSCITFSYAKAGRHGLRKSSSGLSGACGLFFLI